MFSIVDEKQQSLFGVGVAFTIIPTLAVILRFYCRLKTKRQLTASDICLLGALILAWSVTSLAIVNVVVGGVGLHQDALTRENIITYLQTLFAIELLWSGAQGLLKTSICLLYLELFRGRKFKYITYATIALCNAFAATVVLSTTFICSPIQLSWNPFMDGTCGNRNALWLSIGLLNISTDLLVLLLPVQQVWALQITLRQKLVVSSIFGLGFFVCVVSMVRLKFLLAVDFYGDTSYTVTDAILWSVLEPTTGVTVACLPTLGYFIRKRKGNSALDEPSRLKYGKPTGPNSKRLSDGLHESSIGMAMEYPLISRAGASGPEGSISDVDASSDTTNQNSISKAEIGQITVKHEWHVSHSPK